MVNVSTNSRCHLPDSLTRRRRDNEKPGTPRIWMRVLNNKIVA